MDKDLKLVVIVVAALLSFTLTLVGYNLYTEHLHRDQYLRCLELLEETIKSNPKQISLPYCSQR
jgi:hypothetical protein